MQHKRRYKRNGLFHSLVRGGVCLFAVSTFAWATALADESGGGENASYNFVVITKSNSSPYWLAVNAGAEAAAKELGNVTISTQAPPGQTDLAAQISMFNNAVTSRADGILLAAQQAKPLSRPVKKAVEKGIPVVTVDSGVTPNTANSYIATDNKQAAAELANYAAEAVGGKGKYAVITMDLTSITGSHRFEGFKGKMEDEYPDIEYLGVQIANDDAGRGRSQAAAYIASNPELNLLYGTNDWSAVSVGQAVAAAEKKDEIFVAGFDVSAGALTLIKEGSIDASIVQMPYKMGYDGVMRLVDIHNNIEVPKFTPTEVFVLTPDNVSTQEAVTAIQQYMPDYEQ